MHRSPRMPDRLGSVTVSALRPARGDARAAGRGHGGVAVDPEPPRHVPPCADAHPGPGRVPRRAGRLRRRRTRSGEPRSQTSAPSSDRSIARAWQSRAGPRARSRGRGQRAGGPGASESALDDLTRPQQHRRGGALRPADQVHAQVHAVGEVDVQRGRAARTSPRCAGSARGRRARPGRAVPAYASTSVSRTATTPSGARARARSRAGRARPRSAGRSKNDRGSGARAGRSAGLRRRGAHAACRVARASRSRASQLLGAPARAPCRRGRAGGERALHRSTVAYVGGQVRRDLGELVVGELPSPRRATCAPDHEVADDLVRLAERHTLARPATRPGRWPARTPAAPAPPAARC